MPDPKYADRGYLPGQERHDELSSGTPRDAAEQQAASQERKAGGRGIQKGATRIPSLGGKALKGRARLTHEVPSSLPVSDKLKRRARFARRKMTGELARDVGGGRCGMLASALVKLAVEDMAMREAALEEGKRDEARRLGESARGHLIYARSVCALDAKGRPADPDRLPPGFEYVEEPKP